MQLAQNAKYEPGHPEDQQASVDARAPLNRDGDEIVDDLPEDRLVLDTNDPETPHALMELEFERGNTAAEDQIPQQRGIVERRSDCPPSSS